MRELIHVLGDVGVRVFGTTYNGDEVSVKTFRKEFYEGVSTVLNN